MTNLQEFAKHKFYRKFKMFHLTALQKKNYFILNGRF